jgi:hypothetical protein
VEPQGRVHVLNVSNGSFVCINCITAIAFHGFIKIFSHSDAMSITMDMISLTKSIVRISSALEKCYRFSWVLCDPLPAWVATSKKIYRLFVSIVRRALKPTEGFHVIS